MSTSTYDVQSRSHARSRRHDSLKNLSKMVRTRSQEDVSNLVNSFGTKRDRQILEKMQHKWKSIQTLSPESGSVFKPSLDNSFDRLRKSYATMRKSFRLRVSDRRVLNNDDSSASGVKKSKYLIGQIGSGAAKLLRGVYAKSQTSNHQFEFESIHQSTNGSFKVLSSLGNYGSYVSPTLSSTSHQNTSAAAVRKMKSQVELEIEERLQRSRRRVLPSASYLAPNCEKACDDLNMEELEEIKRDNLRLTLTSQKISKLNEEGEFKLGSNGKKVGKDSTGCCCKNLYNDHVHYHHEQQVEKGTKEQQLYCSCASLSSFSSDISLSLGDQRELSEYTMRTTDTNKPRIFTTTASTDHNNELRPETHDTQDNIDEQERIAENISRASSGFNFRDSSLIENKLEEMLDSIFEFKLLEELSRKEQQNELIVDSGQNYVKSSPLLRSLLKKETISSTKVPHEEQEKFKEETSEEWSGSLRNEEQAAPNCCSSLGGVTSTETAGAQLNSVPDVRSATLNVNCGHNNNNNNNNESARVDKQVVAIELEKATGEEQDGCYNVCVESAAKFACSTNSPIDINCNRRLSSRTKLEQKQAKQKSSSTRQQQQQQQRQQQVLTRDFQAQIEDVSDYQDKEKFTEKKNDLLMNKRQSSRRRREELLQSLTEVADVCRAGQQHQRQLEQQQSSTMGLKINPSSSLSSSRIGGTNSNQVYGGEEHLYASISSQTPSPERNLNQQSQQQFDDEEEFYYNPQCSKLQYHCESDGRDVLFDKQLNNCHYARFPLSGNYEQQLLRHHHHHQQQQQLLQARECKIAKQESMTNAAKSKHPKKSFLSKLKNFITPTNNKTIGNKKQERPVSFWSNSEFDQANNNSFRASEAEKNFRWQKSATLTSKSTQNLLGSSLRYLSTSRKSMNLIGTNENSYQDRDDNNERKLSLVSGFLTLRRRATTLNDSQLKKHELVNEIFKDRRVPDGFGDSTDSLPSADSGLSCSNLQNSASSDDYGAVRTVNQSNIYSRGPTELENDNINGCCYISDDDLKASRHKVVGKAIAKVDCNPCAYDKEALVFKQGDIIDILERDQSGTWIGRHNNQVGHFKFINVTELEDESDGDTFTSSTTTEKSRNDNNNNINNNTSTVGGQGVFVTKLEIKSKNNEQQMRNKAEHSSSSTISRRSQSVNTINDNKTNCESVKTSITATTNPVVATTSTASANSIASSPESGGNLSCSSQTIMSSLEQLLFAIGLSGEQVAFREEEQEGEEGEEREEEIKKDRDQRLALTNNDTCCFTQTNGNKKQRVLKGNDDLSEYKKTTNLSYLDILCKGGINNLDSFSAIDDCHELEQIGIIDDEHQRRLLMAARIIRQASQAAKLDFDESYRTKSACSTSPNILAKPMKPPPPPVSSGLKIVEPKVKTATRLSCKSNNKSQSKGNHFNEPIYVNMVNVQHNTNKKSQSTQDTVMTNSGKISRESIVNDCGRDWKVQDLATTSDTTTIHAHNLVDDLDDQKPNEQCLSLHPSGIENQQCNIRYKQSTDCRSHETNSTARSNRGNKINLIKQSDNHNNFPLTDLQASGQKVLPPAGGSHDDYGISDKEADSYYLARGGYLFKINDSGKNRSSFYQKVQEFGDDNLNRCGHQKISKAETEVLDIHSPYTYKFRDASSINDDVFRYQLQQLRNQQQQSPSHSWDKNGALSDVSHSVWSLQQQSMQQEPQLRKKHHINTKTPNLRSQISSKSAYDLKLDLSHFFS